MAGVVANVAINVDAKGAVAELNKVDRAASDLNQSFSGLQAAIAALGIGVAVKSIAAVGNESQKSKNLLQSLTTQYGELGQATESISRIQKLLSISTIDAREGYAQLYAALRSTGVSTQQLEVLFVGLSNAARLSGAGAQETAGAMLALKQGLAAGVVQGENLGSVLEYMPALVQAMTKETDALGLTVNGTGADLKRLGAEGKLTADIVFAAAQKMALANAPVQTASDQLAANFKELQEKLAETFGPVIINAVKTFSASLTALGNWFKANQGSIQTVANILLGLFKALAPGAAAVMLVVKAYQAWQVASKALAATQAFLVALGGPKGVALVAAAAGAAALAYTGLNSILKGTEEEMKKQTAEAAKAKAEFANMATNVQPIPGKVKEIAAATSELGVAAQQTLTFYKDQKIAIEGQISALERGASLTAKRYEALLAINSLEQQQLERSYQQATTEQQRFDIATRLFQKQLEAAQLEYNQAIEAIKLEERKLDLRLQLEQTKLKEIESEADLQKLKASDIKNTEERLKKEQEIDQKRKDALESQKGVIRELEAQVPVQQEIGKYEEQIAAAKFESNKLTAQANYEQKLTSKEIGISQEQASRLSREIANSYTITRDLKNEYSGVVIQIQRAVSAQQQLNAVRAAGGGAPQGAAAGAYWQGGFKAFAEGGMVTKPTLGLIGEGGEPEYVIPASKMDEAMQRYAAGQRGSSVIPTSVNPQVNVTTGPVMNMNGSNYVSQTDFLNGMQTASRRGAEMALQMLQANNNTRRMVGIA